MTDKTINKLIGVGVVGALGYFAYITYGNKEVEREEEENFDVDFNQQSMLLRAAFNPSGFEWMREFDGTDTKTVFAIADKITDFGKLQNVYRTLYKSSLLDDLKRELSVEEFNQFLQIVK